MVEKIARVLLVEDDEDDYILTSDYLSQLSSYQFEIDWVTSPKKALEQLSLNKHDICLLDYQLGAYNGLTVLEKAFKAGCSTPIIMLTGQSDDTIDSAALAAGAADYLAKSEITTPRFTRAIRYALARKEIENERVERLNAEARNQSKDRFLAHLSHELRTPLTSILGYTEILLNSDKAPNAKSELNIILNNGQHLLGLLNNVLDLSKIAVGKLEYNPSEIYLDKFITDIFSLMKVHASDKSLDLIVNNNTLLPEKIYADPVRLRQVIINLLHNAIKFTAKGRVSLTLWTETIDDKEQLHFKVSDTGDGIPKALLETIFKPFEQVEDILSRKEQGAGLGLSICSELVKQMDGVINVTSELNKGSDFIFTINPGDISHQHRSQLTFKQSNSPAIKSIYTQLSGNILIVDDMDDIRLLIGGLCQSFGLNVTYASSGLQAIDAVDLAKAKNEDFDLILMDIHMPELDGKRTIKTLQLQGFNNPIIAVTASAMKGVKQELLALGFEKIIAKPIDKNALFTCLSTILLPKKNIPSSPEATQENSKTNTKVTVNNQQRILVVEDDEDAADVTLLLLESLGIEAKKANSATQCLALLNEDSCWHKVFIDLHLANTANDNTLNSSILEPGTNEQITNGLELAKIIKATYPNIELILVSGEVVPESIFKQVGITKAILKPLNLQILKTLI
ncbi:hybrid sensor histidine kinase/response regulator [Colwellia sp. E2M01]|uniref:response regulator n=1 Tax=Colwellia sp. E2M01 TaxID=2841561 RepID=UPI001C089D9E|nr:response regulator [Colwellia sp. E2M01]